MRVATLEKEHSPSSRSLIASVVSDAQRLLALEVELAKQETRELAARNAVAAGLMAFGGLLVVLALLVAVPILVIVLVGWSWEAVAIWIAAYVVVGVVLLLVGRARMLLGLPPRTVETFKENKEWALRRVRSNGR